jgi:hypothetical protein
MIRMAVSRTAWAAAILLTIVTPRSANAQLSIGTWARADAPSGGTPRLTMTVEACCKGGRRIVYRVEGQSAILMTIDSPMDGTEVPVMVGGKPSGETMAIKLVDPLHSVTIIKMAGKPFGTSRATLSADGNTLTVENEITQPQAGQAAGKVTEKWTRRK